jgi:hypothetical protein
MKVAMMALFRALRIRTFLLLWIGQSISTLQEMVPNDRLGRVSSIEILVSYALLPLGYAVAGYTTNVLGAVTTCILGGALTAIVAIVSVMHPAVRGLD